MATNPNPSNIDWTTVSEDETDETKVTFDIIGDSFTGLYLGQRTQNNDSGSYTQLRFRGPDDGVYFINANYSLQTAMRNVRTNALVRITYTRDKDTGQPTPMRLFKVEIGRQKSRQSTASTPA